MQNKDNLLIKSISDKIFDFDSFYESNFLDENEQSKLLPILKKSKRNYILAGGFEEAQRKILVLFPSYMEKDYIDIPIGAIVFQNDGTLTPRDVLGSLMALGLKREVIGDISIWPEKVQVIIIENLKEYFLNNLNKIKKTNIDPKYKSFKEIVPYVQPFENKSCVVSSNRLDAIVASIFNVSRKNSIEAIKGDLVLHNHLPVSKLTSEVKAEDTISFRGKGKIKILNLDNYTKKGRLRINYKKFI